ncbi:hypothetical protein DSN97_05505 [Deferribacteraceae bacterium V6Fe1]|nr:hypothetical protein DSN97_05505 [Deferribacteraceae bacterium V6Fe1]
MNPNVVPRKLIGLNELKVNDIKLRRLFILIDGKKDLNELADSCHMDLQECVEKINELKKLSAVDVDEDELSGSSGGDVLDEYSLECSDFNDCLIKSLSLFIGPVASLIVEKNVQKKEKMNVYQMHTIIENLSKEIDKIEDRKKFIDLMKGKITDKLKN